MNSAHRHVHLGTRLEVAQKVRRGECSAEQAAARLEVAPDEVRRWVASAERSVTFDEVLASPEVSRLTRRAARLVALVSAAEVTIRLLTRQLAAGKGTAGQGAE